MVVSPLCWAAALLLGAARASDRCEGIPATLRLDWTVNQGKRADEASARIVSRDTGKTEPNLGGLPVCEAEGGDFREGDFVAVCLYCLPKGEYDLVLRDTWGDGWDAATYALEMAGCTLLRGEWPCGTPCRGFCMKGCEKENFLAFDALDRPSPAPTSLRVAYEVDVILDWTKAAGDDGGAKAAASVILRRVGADSAEMGAYELVFDSEVWEEPPRAYPPCEGEVAVSFAKEPAARRVLARFLVAAGDYALELRGDRHQGWQGGLATVSDGYVRYAEGTVVASSDSDEHDEPAVVVLNLTVEHGIPSAAPTLALGPVSVELSVDWTATAGTPWKDGVRLYRVGGPPLLDRLADKPETDLTSLVIGPSQFLIPVHPAASHGGGFDDETFIAAKKGEVVSRAYGATGGHDFVIRAYCWTTGWKGGKFALVRLEDGTLLSTGGNEQCGGAVTAVDIPVFVPGAPSMEPTSVMPTAYPPTARPTTRTPTHAPTARPTPRPTNPGDTLRPTLSPQPTRGPSRAPTSGAPSLNPSATPNPTRRPTPTLTPNPTRPPAADDDDAKAKKDSLDTIGAIALIIALLIIGLIACAALAVAAVVLSRRSQTDGASSRFEDATRRALEDALTKNPLTHRPSRQGPAYSWSTMDDDDGDDDDDDDRSPFTVGGPSRENSSRDDGSMDFADDGGGDPAAPQYPPSSRNPMRRDRKKPASLRRHYTGVEMTTCGAAPAPAAPVFDAPWGGARQDAPRNGRPSSSSPSSSSSKHYHRPHDGPTLRRRDDDDFDPRRKDPPFFQEGPLEEKAAVEPPAPAPHPSKAATTTRPPAIPPPPFPSKKIQMDSAAPPSQRRLSQRLPPPVPPPPVQQATSPSGGGSTTSRAAVFEEAILLDLLEDGGPTSMPLVDEVETSDADVFESFSHRSVAIDSEGGWF